MSGEGRKASRSTSGGYPKICVARRGAKDAELGYQRLILRTKWFLGQKWLCAGIPMRTGKLVRRVLDAHYEFSYSSFVVDTILSVHSPLQGRLIHGQERVVRRRAGRPGKDGKGVAQLALQKVLSGVPVAEVKLGAEEKLAGSRLVQVNAGNNSTGASPAAGQAHRAVALPRFAGILRYLQPPVRSLVLPPGNNYGTDAGGSPGWYWSRFPAYSNALL